MILHKFWSRIMQFSLWVVAVIALSYIELVSSARLKRKNNAKLCFGNLCKGGDKYPTKKIKNLLIKYKHNELKMNETVIEPTKIENEEVGMRSVQIEDNLCQVRRVTMLPTFDKESKLTIVNIKGVYPQELKFEICVEGSGKCRNSGVLDYQTSCKQLYNNVRLLYVHNNMLKFKPFQVPNACVCVYKKNFKINAKEN